MTVWNNYDNEPTFAQRYLPASDFETGHDLMVDFNTRLAQQLADALRLVQEKNERIAELEKAGWDVLPTLELYWKGDRPIPATHATGTLRAVLEGK